MTTVKVYALDLDKNGRLLRICGRNAQEVGEVKMTSTDAGLVLDGWVRRYSAEHGLDLRTHYSNILHKILEGASQDLKDAYAGVSGRGEARAEGATPAEEADRRTKLHMREKNEPDYSAALRAVLSADEELKEAYSR